MTATLASFVPLLASLILIVVVFSLHSTPALATRYTRNSS